MTTALLAGLATGAAVWLSGPWRAQGPAAPLPESHSTEAWPWWRRAAQALLAGTAVALFVGGPGAPVVGVVGAGLTWWVLGRREPGHVRREREQVQRDLPHLVHLLCSALRAGTSPGEAIRLTGAALPGAAADRLRPVAEQLALGGDPGRVWGTLADDAELAPLGRCLARAHETGAPVVDAVDRLADELAALARSEVEQRARTVGVRAALPLGLCLLPAFVLIGIVPLVVGLLSEITR